MDNLYNIELIQLEDITQFKVKHPHYHPATKAYKEFKIKETENCVYGKWGKMFGKYRWLPPFGYFYANYTWIAQENENKEEVTMKARLDDLEWMFSYLFAEAYGFSGFEKDEEYSCDKALIDKFEMMIAEKSKRRYECLLKKDGTFKKYIKPQEYLYKLHESDLGRPLWYNEAKDVMIMGSRSSGKTYFMVGLALWFMCFDGTKSISKDWVNLKISANVVMGSSDDLPTSEFCKRLESAMNYLLTEPELGVYKAKGLDPIPFFGRYMLGQAHNEWRYRFMQNGVESGGTGTSFRPVYYSANKKDGATAAASKRVHLSIVDECGKMQVDVTKIWGNNTAITRRNTKFGVQVFAGTSGAMDLAQPAFKMFKNPEDFQIVSFENVYEDTNGKIGFFIPAFLIKRDFKDENGNTMLKDCLDFFLRRRNDCKTTEVLNEEKMNYPLIPSDMEITKSYSIFPKEDLKKRMQWLTAAKMRGEEENFRRFVKMTWNNNKVEVEYIDPKKAIKIDTFHESQKTNNDKNKSGSTDCHIIIYEEPDIELLKKYKDVYFVGHDPYVSEEKDEGSSLGATFVFKNPKYIPEGYTGNIIVCEYTGKPDSRNQYYQNVEKILAYYGNCPHSFMYEANVNDDFISEYFKKNKKENLLAYRPNKYDSSWKESKVQKYGYLMGAVENKKEMLMLFAEWLMEETELEKDGVRKNLERINSVGLISELINYSYEDDIKKKSNYDRIMSCIGFLIAKREKYNQFKKEMTQSQTSIGSLLSSMFKHN